MTHCPSSSEFDSWASTYDQDIQSNAFPFIGYERTLDKIVEISKPEPGMHILDLGVGTGNLTSKYLKLGCIVTGLDFSGKMLETAEHKYPKVTYIQADLRTDLVPLLKDSCFDRIVSAYTFHHFPLQEKYQLIKNLSRFLSCNGFFVVGDITFLDSQALDRMKKSAGKNWEEEDYWLVNDSLAALEFKINSALNFHIPQLVQGFLRSNQITYMHKSSAFNHGSLICVLWNIIAKMRRFWIPILVSLLFCCSCSLNNPSQQSPSLETSAYIENKGSDTIVNLALAWTEEYHKFHPELRISVSGGGSGTGLTALINGSIQLANASRQIKQEELDAAKANGMNPQEFIIARDAIAVIVNPENPIDNLSIEQLAAIYRGEITNWKEIGGEDRPIVCLSRETNSGTHVFFLEQVIRLGNTRR